MKYSPLQYALNLLKMRDRTVGEIKNKMKLKGFETEEIDKTIIFLQEKDFLDDEKFVTNFIRNRQEFGSAGKYKIKFKLEQLKVDKKLIEERLLDIDSESEKDRAMILAQNWMEKKKSVLPEKKYEKLGRFLAGKGFEVGVIREVLAVVLK